MSERNDSDMPTTTHHLSVCSHIGISCTAVMPSSAMCFSLGMADASVASGVNDPTCIS